MNLTDDDKKWFEALVAPFATKVELARFATKEDLARFATKEDLERFATKEDLAAKLERYSTKEDLERVETNLLTEFHKWASPTEARLRLQKDNLHTIELEMELLSHRIKKLEGPRPS